MFVLKLIASLIFWTVCPILCFASIPFYVYRQLVQSLVKYFRPDWLGMLTMDDAVFYENLKIDSDSYESGENNAVIGNRDDLNKAKLQNVMTIGVIAEGEPNLDKFRTFFSEHILNYKDHRGIRPFEKFHCFYDTWCGYPFWRVSKYFDLDCHIRFLDEFQDNKWTTKSELDAFLGDYYRKPFPWKTPPWELVIVKNLVYDKEVSDYSDEGDEGQYGSAKQNIVFTQPNKFALIFRWHRTIADGYSVANMFVNLFGGEDDCSCKYDFGNGGYYCEPSEVLLDQDFSLWNNLRSVVCNFISFGYETMRLFWINFDNNIWRIPSEILCGSYHIVETNRLPLNIARTVSKKRKVSLEAVMFSAVAGGIRQYFIESGQQRRIPHIMKMCASVPSVGQSQRRLRRSAKLANNWRQLSIRLPIDRSESWRRLEEVDRSIKQQNKSLVPTFVRTVSPFLTALLPQRLNMFSQRHKGSSLTGWNFPAPKNQLLILGEYPTQDFICHHPKLLSDSSLCLTILSYNGAIKYLLSVDKTLFPHRESALKLAKLIEKEFLSSQDMNSHYANLVKE